MMQCRLHGDCYGWPWRDLGGELCCRCFNAVVVLPPSSRLSSWLWLLWLLCWWCSFSSSSSFSSVSVSFSSSSFSSSSSYFLFCFCFFFFFFFFFFSFFFFFFFFFLFSLLFLFLFLLLLRLIIFLTIFVFVVLVSAAHLAMSWCHVLPCRMSSAVVMADLRLNNLKSPEPTCGNQTSRERNIRANSPAFRPLYGQISPKEHYMSFSPVWKSYWEWQACGQFILISLISDLRTLRRCDLNMKEWKVEHEHRLRFVFLKAGISLSS